MKQVPVISPSGLLSPSCLFAKSLKVWSGWQDLNLRLPDPELNPSFPASLKTHVYNNLVFPFINIRTLSCVKVPVISPSEGGR